MYTTINDITIEDLKKKCTMIHYFGLGFIQVKLGPTHRVHFYTDLLPPIVDKEDVHNHRYDFTSKILHGNFHQELFKIVEGNTYTLHNESCKEGYEETTSEQIVCGIEKIDDRWFYKGETYSISHETFHRVEATDAITMLTRSEYKKELAQVTRPINAPKICPFSKKIEDWELWQIVETILIKAKAN